MRVDVALCCALGGWRSTPGTRNERGPNAILVEVIVAQFDAVTDQNRYELVVARLQRRIGIDIDHLDLLAEFSQQRLKRSAHVIA
jgi:hypothetical protein